MLIDAEGQPSNHVNIPNVTQMVILEDMGHLTLPTSSIYLYHTYHAFAQSYPTHCDPLYCIPPDSSVHGVFQARILEWVFISFPTSFKIRVNPLKLSCCFINQVYVIVQVFCFHVNSFHSIFTRCRFHLNKSLCSSVRSNSSFVQVLW